jgi:hypothetical protein
VIYSIISFFVSLAVFFFVLRNVVILFGDEYNMGFLLKNASIVFPIELLVFMFI